MKTTLVFLVICTTAIFAKTIPDAWEDIDFSNVLRSEENPLYKNNVFIPEVYRQPNRGSRIFNGSIVVPNSHPYQLFMIVVFPTGSFICGGSVLTVQSVLTAAHCIFGGISATIIAGGHNIQTLEATQQRFIVQSGSFRTHPDWPSRGFLGDIATMFLPSTFTFNSFVQPTRLPTNFATETFAGEMARVLGWGETETGQTSNVLRQTFNEVLTPVLCGVLMPWSVSTNRILCTREQGTGGCGGDSGGTLTLDRPGSNQPVQIGVVAFGPDCGTPGTGGYTRVTTFLDWIAANQAP